MFRNASLPNPQALMAAQNELEILQKNFEEREFSSSVDGLTVVVKGTKVLSSVRPADGGEMVNISSLQKAYGQAIDQLEQERNLLLVRLRNAIKKRWNVDIKGLIPEIAAAVAYMDKRQADKA